MKPEISDLNDQVNRFFHFTANLIDLDQQNILNHIISQHSYICTKLNSVMHIGLSVQGRKHFIKLFVDLNLIL